MTSIFENTNSKVVIHILHDNTLTEDNRHKFIRTAEKYSQNLELHDVTEYKNKVNQDAVSAVTRTIGTLYRLFIPEILALDRVIYLDCDIIVNLDIRELWEIDIEGNILAGVSGFLHGFPDIVRKKLNEIDYKIYINAGVLIMDLAQIRERGDLFDMSMKWFSRHSHLATLADQDALNSIFRGHIKLLDRKYNNSTLDKELTNTIVHTWPHKSWLGLAGFNSDALFWKMYLRSAWGENIDCEELIDILNIKNDYKPVSLFRRAYRYFKRKLLWWQPVRLSIFLYREAAFRLRDKFRHNGNNNN